MDSTLQIFENKDFGTIRTVLDENGKALFCGKDIAEALGYIDTVNAIKQHCKGVVKHHTLTQGGTQLLSFIPAGDVYRLIASSKLPSAVKFESWVFDEVVPTVMQFGGYLTPEKVEEALCNPDTIIKLATDLKKARAERDEAIRTKCYITAGRDATAMNTASQAVKARNKLKAEIAVLHDQIGAGANWQRATAIPWLKEIFRCMDKPFFIALGRHLTKRAEELGYSIKTADILPGEKYAPHIYPKVFLDIVYQEYREGKYSASLRKYDRRLAR